MPGFAQRINPASGRPSLRVVQCGPRYDNQPDCPPARTSPELRIGRVMEQQADHEGQLLWRIEICAGSTPPVVVHAIRAAGCLLEPGSGDLALVMHQPGGRHYVLSVLEKAEPHCRLRFPGDLTVDASHGACSLQAGQLDLAGHQGMTLYGRELTLAGQRGRFRFVRLDVLAKALDAKIERIKSVGDTIRMAATRLTSHVGRILRLTGFELHRARSVRTEVDERFTVQAGQASILAKDEVTVDAEKIHLG